MQTLVRNMVRPFTPQEIKCLMRQLLKAVRSLDSACIMHRDLKPANLLYDTEEGRLKVCDLGEARRYEELVAELEEEDGVYGPAQELTPNVMSLRYRAPEVLFGATQYTNAVDMWAVGCIFAKLVMLEDLFPGTSEVRGT